MQEEPIDFESWELTNFNIDGHIVLSQKFGHLKMMRSDDGLLTLIEDAKHGLIDQEKDTPTNFFNRDTTLGFVLDIGIQKKKWLTHGNGFYFGTKMIDAQSNKKISQSNFDKDLFEKIGDLIQTYFQSGDKKKEIEAVKLQYLINEYNNARLLYPNFYGESYLSLMRIIDALGGTDSAHTYASDYSTFVATISPKLNQELYDKLKALAVYSERMEKASEVFTLVFSEAVKNKWSCHKTMSSFNDADKFVFSCFYSAYQYRNKFVHKGFPFPSVVKESYGVEEDSAIAYISPTLGMSWSRFNRPTTGLKEGDSMDIHEIVGNDAETFKKTYFLLVPTWYFLKEITRLGLINKINSL